MSYKSTEAELEVKIDAILGEGPVWDEAESKLYWIDIMSGRVFIYSPADKTNIKFDLGEHVGAIALREKGGLVTAMKSGFEFINLKTGGITKIEDPESHLSGNRFNDGKCDPGGRFWAGTMSYDQTEGAGSLYCLNSDLSIDLKLEGVTISNGLAWNREKNKFYYIDTPTGNIYSFDFDLSSGKISNRSLIRHIDQNEGYPDGMTIDTDDNLWISLYGGGKVIRIDPANGNTNFEVLLPVPKVTSCTFGGNNLNELYITTCRENMSDEEIRQFPLSGSLFKADVPFNGLKAYRFGG